MTSSIAIREVGPRDGLQPEAPVPAARRAALVEALVGAGLRVIEIAAFVSPRAVPAMADADEVVRLVGRPPGVTRLALVPNVRGAELALASGVDELTFTASASEAYSQKNVRMSVSESVETLASITALAGSVPVDAVVSCAFGSPYEGDIPPRDVAALCDRLRGAGASSIGLADTTGMATPRRIREVYDAVGSVEPGLHLHETRGTALVNAYAAMELGVTRFDTSVGGLGGSPFAAGAAGNLATEDLVHLCDDLGISTGVSLDRLLEVSAMVAELVGHPVPSRIAAAGPRSRLA